MDKNKKACNRKLELGKNIYMRTKMVGPVGLEPTTKGL